MLGSGLPSLGRLGVVYPRSETGTTGQSTGRRRRKRSVGMDRNGRNGLATLSPSHGSLRTHNRIKRVGGTKQEESVSCVWAFASVGLDVGTLNVQGGLSVYSPGVKLPGLLKQCDSERIGVLAIQETHCIGLVRRDLQDMFGQIWNFCSGGPMDRSEQGTGFLVRSDLLRIVRFKPFSPRVSLIEIEPATSKPTNRAAPARGVGGKPCQEGHPWCQEGHTWCQEGHP